MNVEKAYLSIAKENATYVYEVLNALQEEDPNPVLEELVDRMKDTKIYLDSLVANQ